MVYSVGRVGTGYHIGAYTTALYIALGYGLLFGGVPMYEYVTWGATFSTLWYWIPTHIHDDRRGPELIVDYWGFGSIFIYRIVELEDE